MRPPARRVEPAGLARPALALLLLATGAFLFYETRDTTFWADEWQWVVERRGNDLDTFLRPHNEHFSLFPIAVYKLLFVTAGLDFYAPYRLVVIALHLVCGALIFVYVSRRIGAVPGLFAAALILTLGPGWQGFIWTFQITWLTSLGAGIGALLMLDRGDRRGDVAAAALMGLSLASSGIALPIMLGVVVDVLWGRRDRSAVLIIAMPLVLYALWWIGYGVPGSYVRHNIVLVPGFAADSAASALSALTGLHGLPITEDGVEPDRMAGVAWGRPLAVLALPLLVMRLRAMRAVPVRVWALGAILLSFWVSSGLERVQISPPDTSRYMFVSGIFIVLLVAELGRGLVLPRRAAQAAALAIVLAIVANLGDLRAATRFLRATAQSARADLGALEMTRPLLRPGSLATSFPGYPFVRVRTDLYFAAAEANGSPAASAPQIAASREKARGVADAELVRIHEVGLRPGGTPARDTAPPRQDAADGGTVRARDACRGFRPLAVTRPGQTSALDLTLPANGITVTAHGGSAGVNVRRFAVLYPGRPLARVAAGSTATLRIGPDRAPNPWHVRVTPTASVTVCAAR